MTPPSSWQCKSSKRSINLYQDQEIESLGIWKESARVLLSITCSHGTSDSHRSLYTNHRINVKWRKSISPTSFGLYRGLGFSCWDLGHNIQFSHLTGGKSESIFTTSCWVSIVAFN
ncbi:uncharacterized protein LOC131237247 [Magnolia sinica]|uniref:uncharacterized protein LOC131237247 n=1 Tax=Magnolia sinica TaxID=86752 RepID=UPI00265831AA|nr:uncharacterized protein LOC131237247 [Magnolia sinica]